MFRGLVTVLGGIALLYGVTAYADAEMSRSVQGYQYHQINGGYDIQPKYNVVRECGKAYVRCRNDYYPQVSRQYYIVTDPNYVDAGLLRDHH